MDEDDPIVNLKKIIKKFKVLRKIFLADGLSVNNGNIFEKHIQELEAIYKLLDEDYIVCDKYDYDDFDD